MLEILLIIGAILIIATLFDKWLKKGNKDPKKSHPSSKTTTSHSSDFKSVKIGEQVWMENNLSIAKYRNGEPIEEIQNIEQWGLKSHKKGLPLCCYPNNDPSLVEEYGRLYNFQVIEDPRGLVPDGWRIPTTNDWRKLVEYLGGWEKAIDKIKSKKIWKSGFGGSNSSGFNALPTGYLLCNAHANIYETEFVGHRYMSLWWVLDVEGQEDEFLKKAMRIKGNDDFYEQSYVPYSACSIRLIKS